MPSDRNNENTENSANAANKKDKFSKAAREQLGSGGLMGSFAGDLSGTVKSAAAAPDAGTSQADAKASGTEEKTVAKHENTPKNIEAENSGTDKKDLSGGGHAVRLTPVEQGRLKKIDPQQLMASDFRYDEPPVWKKPLIIGLAAVFALALLFFAFVGSRSQPRIYLSNSEIKDGIIKNLPTTNLVFPKGKEIFIHFNAGSRFGTDKLIIRVTEIYQDSGGTVKEDNIGVNEQTVKPSWKKLYTLFQQDYFDHPGQYKLYIQAAGGATLAVQDFKVK